MELHFDKLAPILSIGDINVKNFNSNFPSDKSPSDKFP